MLYKIIVLILLYGIIYSLYQTIIKIIKIIEWNIQNPPPGYLVAGIIVLSIIIWKDVTK